MEHGALSDRIRQHAVEKFVRPARRNRQRRLSLAVRDLMNDLESQGFPKHHQNQFCTAIQTRNFLQQNGLEIEKIDGPPSGRSTTVVVHYRLKDDLNKQTEAQFLTNETPSERAKRVTSLLSGRLRKQIKELGGTLAYMDWVRREGE